LGFSERLEADKVDCHDSAEGAIMATIVGHLSIAQLEQRVRAARDAVEAKHFQAIRLLAQGRTFVEVADILAFVPRWVEELAQRYNRHGPAALGNQRRNNGRAASVLTAQVLAAVAERIKLPPDDGGLWTGPKVAAWMTRFLGREKVHAQLGSAEEARLVGVQLIRIGCSDEPGKPSAGDAQQTLLQFSVAL
jgi:hypothetical protein